MGIRTRTLSQHAPITVVMKQLTFWMFSVFLSKRSKAGIDWIKGVYQIREVYKCSLIYPSVSGSSSSLQYVPEAAWRGVCRLGTGLSQVQQWDDHQDRQLHLRKTRERRNIRKHSRTIVVTIMLHKLTLTQHDIAVKLPFLIVSASFDVGSIQQQHTV